MCQVYGINLFLFFYGVNDGEAESNPFDCLARIYIDLTLGNQDKFPGSPMIHGLFRQLS